MKIRAIAISLIAAILALLAYYILIGPPPKTETVRLVAPPDIIASLPIWIAEEKMMFTKRNLDVRLVSVTSSPMMVETMLAGNADVLPAVSLSDMASLGTPGNSALLRTKIFSHSRMRRQPSFESILVPTASSISTLRDLEGKTIAVYPGETSARVVLHYLSKIGADSAKIKILKAKPPEHRQLLDSGTVEASHIYEPNRTVMLLSGQYRELAESLYATLNEPSAVGCSAIQRSFLEENPKVASLFLDAWDEAISFIRDDPDEARSILQKRLSLPPEAAKGATWVDATQTTENSFDTLNKTIQSLQGADSVPPEFVFEEDMVLTR